MPPQAPARIGLLGLEATGLAERSIALDLVHGLCLESELEVAFHLDLAFTVREFIWATLTQMPSLDALLVCLRPTAALLLPGLRDALSQRVAAGLSNPLVVFGGPTALAAASEIKTLFPDSMVWKGSAEEGFPHFLVGLMKRIPSLNFSTNYQTSSPKRFGIPAHFSTEQCVKAGGSVWIEASRGCRMECSFCVMSHEDVSKTWLPRPLGELFDEIELIQDRFGVNYFSFSDLSAFETDAYTDAFLSEYQQRKSNFLFRCDLRLARAKHLSQRLRLLRDAGLQSVYVGIESLVPEYQRLYGKRYPGRAIIDHIRSLGILVSAGFIMLDPLFSPEQFRRQVEGARNEGILELVATPFKTARIQRGTRFEKVAAERGILRGLAPDLYSFHYRCLDPRMESVRQIIEFFHQTTKDVYYNPYIEGQIRQAGHWDQFVDRLRKVTLRYKEAQMTLLDDLSAIGVEQSRLKTVLSLSVAAAERFDSERARIFAETALDYEDLLDQGIPYYRRDLEIFLDAHKSVPLFDPEHLDLSDLND